MDMEQILAKLEGIEQLSESDQLEALDQVIAALEQLVS
jgi:hypothetical protein